jgi:hypothetical protein
MGAGHTGVSSAVNYFRKEVGVEELSSIRYGAFGAVVPDTVL